MLSDSDSRQDEQQYLDQTYAGAQDSAEIVDPSEVLPSNVQHLALYVNDIEGIDSFRHQPFNV